MKAMFTTFEKGIANRSNHQDAQVGDKIQLTADEIGELGDGPVYMVIDYILGDYLIGEIAVMGEVAGFGLCVNDSPFR